jgi:AI-2 transport protein TqsA
VPTDYRYRNEQVWLAVGSLMILALVALGAALSYTAAVMIPFVLAVFLATVVAPVVDFQVVRLRVPQSIAVLVTLLLVLAILVVLGLLLIVAVQTVLHTAGEYSESFASLTERGLEQLRAWHIEIDEAEVTQGVKNNLPYLATQTVGTATGLLSNGVLILIFVIFLLSGRNPRLIRTGVYAEIEAKVRIYLATQTALAAATGLLVWIALALLGLRMAGLFGMLTFLLNFIPSIGSVIATLLPIPIAVAQYDGLLMILAVVVIPGAIQTVIGNAIQPKLLGQGMHLHPVTVLLALAFWGLLWGVIGMLLAVPITASIRIVLVRFPTTRPLGDLLAGDLPGASREVRS